jgi:hypothetical protein
MFSLLKQNEGAGENAYSTLVSDLGADVLRLIDRAVASLQLLKIAVGQ